MGGITFIFMNPLERVSMNVEYEQDIGNAVSPHAWVVFCLIGE